MTMANIIPFQPREGTSRGVADGLVAEIILFPGVRYERRDFESEPAPARTRDKAADA